MDATSDTHACNHLTEIMDNVCDDHTPRLITRSAKRAVVVLSLEDHEALEETAHLLRSPANARRLLDAIAALEMEAGTTYPSAQPGGRPS
jgi:antitoxin YefM